MVKRFSNQELSQLLLEIADLLETQEADRFRTDAYRKAAQTIAVWQESVAGLLEDEGLDGLIALPTIGEGIGQTLKEYLQTGRSELLERLQGEMPVEEFFQKIPGIGPKLASQIVERLHLHSLEELELAAYDGRLQSLAGFGPKRIRMVRLTLESLLNQTIKRRHRRLAATEHRQNAHPDIATLLMIDSEYREKAEHGQLRKIRPRRFNPEGKTWLPIYHTQRDGWDFTVLFSNTQRAHQLGKNYDWVIIYYDRDGLEGQVTVVTETRGALKGKRVVRGWEIATERFYEKSKSDVLS